MQDHHNHLHHHHHQHHSTSIDTGGGDVGGGGGGSGGGDRFPQWSIQETRDFLAIRAELDPTFMETKRNKLLWDVISTRMKEKGYNRSADQCKCKWKNLVTRYKGCETMEPEGMRQQFPFYNELQAIFAVRMQRMLWIEAEGGASGGSNNKKKTMMTQQSSDEEDDENEESDGEQKGAGVNKKKRKVKGSSSNNNNNMNINSRRLREILGEFMKQQTQMELEWRRAYEEREEERRAKEMEWRQTMEALENERIMMDRRWREREEQRRIREEARADKRDALITALLNRLTREDHHI